MKSLTLPDSIVARLRSKGSAEWRTRVVVSDDSHRQYDLDRAFHDPGFATDDVGTYLKSNHPNQWPEKCYRYHYLHVPAVHVDDDWDIHGNDPRRCVYPIWLPSEAYRVKGHSGLRVTVKYVHCERHNRRWWWCVGMEVER